MKKDLFDLLKEFIIENAEIYETAPLEGGVTYFTNEIPTEGRHIIQAELNGDLLHISYDDLEEDYERILIAPTLSRDSSKDEEIYITKTKDDISIDISINKK